MPKEAEEYEEGEIVLCTVVNVVGTTVFVKIDGNRDGSIVLSEIAPGRIRNLRDYVVPNKKIVCKVLRKEGNNYHLSLRRVTGEERKEILEMHEKEKSSLALLKSVLKEKCPKILEKIEGSIHDFLQEVKKDAKLLEKYCTKEEIESIIKILQQKKEKEKEISRDFILKSEASDGIKKIRKILDIKDTKDIKKENLSIKYLGNSQFKIKIKAKDLKQADSILNSILEEIKEKSKQEKCEFMVKK